MNKKYVRYRKFLRDFREVRDGLEDGEYYEVVGGNGETIGFFFKEDPNEGN